MMQNSWYLIVGNGRHLLHVASGTWGYDAH